MKITIEAIENLQKSLKDLPPVENKEREVTKPDAVKLLASEIADLQERGYTIEMIAEILTKNGLELKASTLKSYITRARASGGRNSGARKKRSKVTPRNTAHEDKEKASGKHESKAPSGAKVNTDGGQNSPTDAGSINTTDVKTSPVTPSGQFSPRGDSDAI
ncbi:hypothetical protein [Pseudomonas siliginis]|uniref:hypothetical protein n=1 Tax=Pseudomonas siliginis TaxID=2842346 RepID=UPI00209303DD|nr:hypothetical protein [Pseudomonas siliginis]UST77211.1 hypothetical protein NF676_00075 [Pseudomonas siliginis]